MAIIYYTIPMASHTSHIVYVTRDIERALGILPQGSYSIITNNHPYAEEMHSLYPDNVYLIESENALDTHELLSHPDTIDIINKLKASVIVFKNTTQIEQICKDSSWNLLNPSAVLAEKIENKITQIEWLGDMESLLPPHKIAVCNNIVWEKKPCMLQWAHSHTGDGTLLIQNEKDLSFVQSKFPLREARVTDFIKGPMFTANIIVSKDGIRTGNISYQITGILPFTENPWSTIGNDWSVPHTILTEAHIEEFNSIALRIGTKMQESGWKGLFGIDVIYDEERDSLHLIEINARQPASTTYESQLQAVLSSHGVAGISTFQAHLNALTDTSDESPLVIVNDGAQIIQRIAVLGQMANPTKLIDAGYTVISYPNTKINSDLLRIQSTQGIMETHTKFNARGKHIIELL